MTTGRNGVLDFLNTASSPANVFHQLLKCIHNPPKGTSPAEAARLADEESVLLRAYGRDTSILIDRERRFPPNHHHHIHTNQTL